MSKFKLHKRSIYFFSLAVLLSSCGNISSLTRTITDNRDANPYLNGSFEPLKRSEYTLLNTTTGKASASQLYLLFFPIGKARTNMELELDAYSDAVKNCPTADAVILPRAEYKRFFIPLIVLNYSSRKITVTGRGVKVKE